MAKVQTRRAVSLNGLLYQRFKERCDADGISVSSVVDSLVRRWLGEVPTVKSVETMPEEDFKEVQVRPAPPAEVVEKRKAAFREAMLKRKAEEAEAMAKATREREERAITNPCRREGCHIIVLHEAHLD